jgi:hypothetical protein
MAQNPHKEASMRYELRWSNGCWKLFDTFMYASVYAYGLKGLAQEAVDQANADMATRR